MATLQFHLLEAQLGGQLVLQKQHWQAALRSLLYCPDASIRGMPDRQAAVLLLARQTQQQTLHHSCRTVWISHHQYKLVENYLCSERYMCMLLDCSGMLISI
jgi:hypothetical protein